MTPTAIVLFSGGAGAWELGAEWAGVDVLASCESEPIRRDMLRANFGEEHIIFPDVRTLTGEQIRSTLAVPRSWRPWAVLASPPCQDASLANQARVGLDGERTGLFRQAVRLVRELRPDWVAFENVAGLTVGECQRILGWLGADYRGWVHRVGDEDVGAPQRAWRRFILAKRISTPAQEPLRRGRQPRHGAPDCAASGDEIEVGAEIGESARDGRPLARCAPLGGGDRGFDLRDWRDHASEAVCRRLRMANGLPAGLAKQVQEAYGDTFPPQLAHAVVGAMMDAG